jgi:hypothetical protein
LILSLQNILSRNLGVRVRVNDVKGIREDRVSGLLGGSEDLALAGRVSKETIDFLTYQIHQIEGGGGEAGEVKGGIPVSSDASWSRQDIVVNDHVGDGTDQPFCDGGGLCVVLSEGSKPVDE